MTYESNDFYWELGSDSGVIDLHLLQEALTPASFINYDVYSSQGDILFNSYIQKEIGVNITAIASDLIFIDHSYFGFFDSIELSFTFVSENYQSSLMQMSFMLLCRNGNIDCLEIDYYP
ncbi:hypothetical protein [Candidatus Hodarchaeum mangrovi]